MRPTKKSEKSGVKGQAIVLVTLALIALCGIMGLAIDLGWSYFLEKQAQTAADLSALAGAQEALTRLGNASGFVCPVAPSGSTQVYCQPTEITCTVVSSTNTSNLWNGCLYGQQNGFIDGALNGRQTVKIQANDSSVLPATAPGVTDIAYWVSVRTTQTVPQLFSSILGHTEGLVAARATAALVGAVRPGSFWGLNHAGDCVHVSNTSGFRDLCGVDVDLAGSKVNNKTCANSGGASAALCAANGIVLSSTCHGDGSQTGCVDSKGGGKGNWAGQTQGSANVWASQAQVQTGGAVDQPSHWTPPPSSSNTATTDPYNGKTQPPLQGPSSPVQSCAITGNTIDGGSGAGLVLGPYQYYATSNGTTPTGARITLAGNLSFSASTGTCPGTLSGAGASQSSSQFPLYVFYGGMEMDGNINFGAGQYVMAGVNSQTAASLLLFGGNQTITGNTGAGTQFITTDLNYPGLSTQYSNTSVIPSALTDGTTIPMYQGFMELKAGNSTNVQLQGLDKSQAPSNLGAYNGSLFWQDRRNSTLISDSKGNVTSAPCNAAEGGSSCSSVPSSLTANGVTETSPGFVYDAAVQMNLKGTLYQARGAWFSFQGNADIASGLQIITGMVEMTGGGQVSLLPSPLPIKTYIVALIH